MEDASRLVVRSDLGAFMTLRARHLAEDLFWSKVTRPIGEGCWLWTGPTNGKGYGRFSVNGKQVGAHRFAMNWMWARYQTGSSPTICAASAIA